MSLFCDIAAFYWQAAAALPHFPPNTVSFCLFSLVTGGDSRERPADLGTSPSLSFPPCCGATPAVNHVMIPREHSLGHCLGRCLYSVTFLRLYYIYLYIDACVREKKDAAQRERPFLKASLFFFCVHWVKQKLCIATKCQAKELINATVWFLTYVT